VYRVQESVRCTYGGVTGDDRQQLIVDDTPDPQTGITATANEHLLRAGEFQREASHRSASVSR